MDDWCTPTADAPSFEAAFSRPRLPPPPDCTVTTKTKTPKELDINISGSQLQGFGRLSIENLMLSNDRGLAWATGRLRDYGPFPSQRYRQYWDPQMAVVPRIIRSEEDTTTYLKLVLFEPAVTAAIFIRAQHLGLAAAQGAAYPDGNWELINCSTTGAGSGRSDHALVRFSTAPVSQLRFVALMEFKTWHVCQSNGEDVDGQHVPRIPVIQQLERWLAEKDGYIPMDPPESLPRSSHDFNWYNTAWKKKLQKILFQVRSDPIRTSLPLTNRTVLARHRSA
jgi:hypothetical protein